MDAFVDQRRKPTEQWSEEVVGSWKRWKRCLGVEEFESLRVEDSRRCKVEGCKLSLGVVHHWMRDWLAFGYPEFRFVRS